MESLFFQNRFKPPADHPYAGELFRVRLYPDSDRYLIEYKSFSGAWIEYVGTSGKISLDKESRGILSAAITRLDESLPTKTGHRYRNALYVMRELLNSPSKDGFHSELTSLLNRWSSEKGSDIPDHILADYLISCLHAFDTAANARATRVGMN